MSTLKFISFLLLLPTGPILISFVGLFVSLKKPMLGKAIIAASLFLLLMLSTPFVASLLMANIQNHTPINDSMLKDRQIIVVLGGGSYQNAPEYSTDTIGEASLVRLRYAIYLKKLTGLPIIASGGSPNGGQSESGIMQRTAFTDFSTEVDWIEDLSNNTYENAKLTSIILKYKGIDKIVLVTHAWHLSRSVQLFESEGLDVLPAPTAFVLKDVKGIYSLIPEAGAMSASNLAIHEFLGKYFFSLLY